MIRKWLAFAALGVVVLLTLYWYPEKTPMQETPHLADTVLSTQARKGLWTAPDSNSIPRNDTGELIRYGKKLIHSTSRYFGPQGLISRRANGMNCQNCHLDAGTRPLAGNFGSVAALFPRFSDRRGTYETVYQRISDCFKRSMNGRAPDSNSREMKAMQAYILWVGKEVGKGRKPAGTGLEIPPFLERAADPQNGKRVFMEKCQRCHGADGQGKTDSVFGYLYPPLWGDHSYNTAAGLYRLSKFAAFVKNNMPFGSSYDKPQLNFEEAWDLAAFVNSQPRPVKKFRNDWPNTFNKPIDLPEGPFPDTFPADQHKYGPFGPILRSRAESLAKNHR